MKTSAYLGLDLGGTGVKAGVFDRDGTMLAFARRAVTPATSDCGHVDISIETVYDSARDASREAISRSGAEIVAMSISSQGETFVTLDECGLPLHDAIIWYDSRAVAQWEALRELLRSDTGAEPAINPIDTICKIRWLQENRPDIIAKARRFLLLPDYFAYRLTGIPAIDLNTAVTTGMLASDADRYDPVVLQTAEVDVDMLSNLIAPGTPIGKMLSQSADEWGLSRNAVLIAGTNDQYAGALGAGNCRPGVLSETTGTCQALVTLVNHRPDVFAGGLDSGRFPIAGLWFILAYAKTAGIVLDWFRNEFCSSCSWPDMELMAARVPPGSLGLVALPHFDGTVSPVPNPYARGAFYGLTLRHKAGHMFRALLESLAYSLRENLELIRSNGLTIDVVRSIGGGSTNDLWLQIKADVLAMRVEKPVVSEAAVLGASMLAATGIGDFGSLAQSSENFYRVDTVITPCKDNADVYTSSYNKYLGLKTRMYDELQ